MIKPKSIYDELPAFRVESGMEDLTKLTPVSALLAERARAERVQDHLREFGAAHQTFKQMTAKDTSTIGGVLRALEPMRLPMESKSEPFTESDYIKATGGTAVGAYVSAVAMTNPNAAAIAAVAGLSTYVVMKAREIIEKPIQNKE